MASSTSLGRSATSVQQQRSVQAYKEPTIGSLSNCSSSSLAAGGCRGSPLSCSTASSSPSLKSHHHNRKGGSAGDCELTLDSLSPSGGSRTNVTAQRLQCFKTKRCRFWMESRCTRWDRCTYAHTDVELRIPPDLTKTKICSRWKRGACEKSASDCAYAHGTDDLRDSTSVTPTSTNHSPSSVLSSVNTQRPPNVLSSNGGQQILHTGKSSSTPVAESSLPLNSHRSTQTIGSTVSTAYTNRKDSVSSLHTLDDNDDEEEQLSTDSSFVEHSDDYSSPLPPARQPLTMPFSAAPASAYQPQILLPEATTTTANPLSCYSIATPTATPYRRTTYPDSTFIWSDLLVSLTSPYDD